MGLGAPLGMSPHRIRVFEQIREKYHVHIDVFMLLRVPSEPLDSVVEHRRPLLYTSKRRQEIPPEAPFRSGP